MSEDYLKYCLYYHEYVHFLQLFPDYDKVKRPDNKKFQYDFNSKYLSQLEDNYRVKEIIPKQKSDIDTILKLLRWVYEKLLYREPYEANISHLHAVDILKISNAERKSVNCLCHATVLTEVLLLYGYYAKSITCLPMGTFPYDCHNITVVYVESMEKWIALDPSFNLYFSDQNSQLISLDEIRQACIKNMPVYVISNQRFFNEETKTFQETYMRYMAKNLFRFKTNQNVIQKIGDTTRLITYELVPKNYLPDIMFFQESENKITYYITDPDFFWEYKN